MKVDQFLTFQLVTYSFRGDNSVAAVEVAEYLLNNQMEGGAVHTI